MFQDEIQANLVKMKELEKLKPVRKLKKTPAEVKAEEARRKRLAKESFLMYRCLCPSCLYSYGMIDDGGMIENDHYDK